MVDAVYEMYRMVQSLEGMYTKVIYQFKIIFPSTAWLIQFVIVSKGQILYCQNLHHRCGTVFHGYILNIKCDRISENGSKSHIKSHVFQHIFKCISTYGYVFLKYLWHNFDNLSIKFHVML